MVDRVCSSPFRPIASSDYFPVLIRFFLLVRVSFLPLLTVFPLSETQWGAPFGGETFPNVPFPSAFSLWGLFFFLFVYTLSGRFPPFAAVIQKAISLQRIFSVLTSPCRLWALLEEPLLDPPRNPELFSRFLPNLRCPRTLSRRISFFPFARFPEFNDTRTPPPS